MSDVRRGQWALVGLSVLLGAVACVDGAVPAGQGAAANMSLGGASGTGNTIGAGNGAGASGMGTIADGSCKDTLTDPAHCGSCSTACAQGQICDQGVCKAPVANCTAPQVSCNGVCADRAPRIAARARTRASRVRVAPRGPAFARPPRRRATARASIPRPVTTTAAAATSRVRRARPAPRAPAAARRAKRCATALAST